MYVCMHAYCLYVCRQRSFAFTLSWYFAPGAAAATAALDLLSTASLTLEIVVVVSVVVAVAVVIVARLVIVVLAGCLHCQQAH